MTALRSSAPSAFLSGVMESAISCGGEQGKEGSRWLSACGVCGEGGHRNGLEPSLQRLLLV